MNRHQRRTLLKSERLEQKREMKTRRHRAGEVTSAESRLPPPAAWRSRVPLEDKPLRVSQVERFDNFAGLRRGLRHIAAERDDWAGIPMPLDGEQLVIEPRYPKAKELMEIGASKNAVADEGDLAGAAISNRFWSVKKGREVVIFRTAEGKVDWGTHGGVNHFANDISTAACSVAWGIEQEHNALMLLAGLIAHHAFKTYLLTGMFTETSARSGVRYAFRKLRPTVAISRSSQRILCALCLHPIGYYAGSWAGAMCPTDDVVAHLMMMRGDERLFWARANQIPPWHPLAGL